MAPENSRLEAVMAPASSLLRGQRARSRGLTTAEQGPPPAGIPHRMEPAWGPRGMEVPVIHPQDCICLGKRGEHFPHSYKAPFGLQLPFQCRKESSGNSFLTTNPPSHEHKPFPPKGPERGMTQASIPGGCPPLG